MLTMPASRPFTTTGTCRTRFSVISALRLSTESSGVHVATTVVMISDTGRRRMSAPRVDAEGPTPVRAWPAKRPRIGWPRPVLRCGSQPGRSADGRRQPNQQIREIGIQSEGESLGQAVTSANTVPTVELGDKLTV